MIENGDDEAKLVYEAMAYQVAKEIGAASAVLHGKIDAIVLTGGLAYGKGSCRMNKRYVLTGLQMLLFIQEKMNLQALAEGALRVLRVKKKLKEYPEL